MRTVPVVHATLADWFPFLAYGVIAFLIPASMVAMSFIFGAKPQKSRAKVIPFESGVSTGPPKQQRFTISFYLTAMLFIVFDIEIVFLYPLAVTLNVLGWFAFLELLFFVVILAVAYVYIWRKGALEWR
jgi:NADH-quinone oxidoreductase subunit A